MVEKDFSLLIGLSVALTVFLVVSLTSIRILRRKGRSPSMYTMTNLSKPKKNLHMTEWLLSKQKILSSVPDVVLSYAKCIIVLFCTDNYSGSFA